MHTVVADSDHSGKQIVNADLTLIPPTSLHPDVLSREVSVLDALADVDTSTIAPVSGDALVWDGVAWKPRAVGNSWYREAFDVAALPATLTVAHNLATDVVSVTTILRGTPNVVVLPEVAALDVNTVQVTLQGGATGTYEVLVLSEGGSGDAAAPTEDYLPLAGGTLTGPLVANAGVDIPSGQSIDFTGTALGARVNLYANSFYLGIQGGTLQYVVTEAGNKHQFLVGTTERARVDQGGIVTTGVGIGDTWHGWFYDTAASEEHLRSYQGEWSFRKTNGSTPGIEVARITESGLGPQTTISVSFVEGWTGTLDFRVNPASVTMRMNVHNPTKSIAEFAWSKVCGLPSGVPAPWANQRVAAYSEWADSWQNNCIVSCQPDGVFVHAYDNRAIGTDHTIQAVITYSR